mmetsp:Transcript_12622/g.39731  ORF Transcript_12622/g.39731 Transcript_12622/m.39731 type:complete len:229 (+) Transcript_12622:14-700(+)
MTRQLFFLVRQQLSQPPQAPIASQWHFSLDERLHPADLLKHRSLARAARLVAPLCSQVIIPDLGNVLVEERAQLAIVGELELGDLATLFLGQLDGRADDVVRLAEGHALAHEVVGQVGGEQRRRERGAHPLARDGERREHARGDLQRGAGRGGRVEKCALVLLHVLVVRGRQALHHREQRRVVADHARALAAQQLERVGVLLLRHERRAGRVGVGVRDEAKLGRAEDD